MGPRLMSRGKDLHVRNGEFITEASMGPRLMSRGKCGLNTVAALNLKLQWGRGS